jgi:Bacterial Ig domain/K319L-like, PKD domain
MTSTLRRTATGCVLLLISILVSHAAPRLTISQNGYEITLIQPVAGNPAAFELTARATAVNRGDAALGVSAQIVGDLQGVTILDGEVRFGDVPARGSALSQDTFQLRVPQPSRSSETAMLRNARSVLRSLEWTVSCGNCGGNRPPVANAGPDQTAPIGGTVTLNGSTSTDPDGQPITYAWSFVSRPQGSTATLADPTTVGPTFSLDREGDYVVQLIVSDGTLTSAPDTVQIATRNSPPVANAGSDQSVAVGRAVVLDGTASTDVDGDLLTYSWSVVTRPAGSVAEIANASQAIAGFTPDVVGTYSLQLIVHDGTAPSTPDTVVIETVAMNSRPSAAAGPDASATVGSTIQLDGRGSSDPDFDGLTYSWSLISKPPKSQAALAGADTSTPSFTIDLPGSYVAQLIVSDRTAESDPDTVVISTVNSAPVAAPQAVQTVRWKTTVQLDGSLSSDADSDPLTHVWSVLSRPSNSNAQVSDTDAVAPTIVVDRPGMYVVQLIVNDGTVDSAPVSISITATNETPVAGNDQATAVTTTPIEVNVLANDVDADGDSLAIASVVQPANGTASIASGGIRYVSNAGFTGTDSFTYSATDGAATATATVTVVVSSSEPPPPVNVASVVVDRTTVFLTGVGQSATATATAFDDHGLAVNAPFSWTSSRPAEVTADATGRIAAAAIGSALVVAEAGGVRSAPVFVIVAEPKPGALLLQDSQIVSVGDALGVPEGDAPGVGTQYEVTVTGLASPPAPGTVVLAAGNAAVAGKAVSVRADGPNQILTLEFAPMFDLLNRYRIDWSIDLKPYEFAFDQPAPPAGQLRASALAPAAASSVNPIECKGNFEAALGGFSASLDVKHSLKFEVQDYRDNPALPPDSSRHVLTGTDTITGTVEFLFNPNFSVDATCTASGHIIIPITGWAAVFVSPAVKLGVGVELKGEFEVAHGQLGISGEIGSTQALGWECANDQCQRIQSLDVHDKFKSVLIAPDIDQMHVTLSAHAFVLIGLDLKVATKYFSIVEGRLGPKQSADLGLEDDQAHNAAYASTYNLDLAGSLKPGSALKTALEQLFGEGVNVTFGAEYNEPLGKSPRGTFTASKNQVQVHDTVDFTVQLDADSVQYPVVGYNVTSIELYQKKENEEEFKQFHSIPVSASGNQTSFTHTWTATTDDYGKNQFAAFVKTALLGDLVPLQEVSAHSVQEVDVRCDLPAPASGLTGVNRASSLAAAVVLTCPPDEWAGETYLNVVDGFEITTSNVVWRRKAIPPVEGVEPDPRVATYEPTGSLRFVYTAVENLGCVVEPKNFTLTAEDGFLSVDYRLSPAMFLVTGRTGREVTMTCSDGEPTPLIVAIDWVLGAGEITENGTVIQGSTSSESGSSSFRFVRR